MANMHRLDEHFPGWKLVERDGKDYVIFIELGRSHVVKVKENSRGRYIKYLDVVYYL